MTNIIFGFGLGVAFSLVLLLCVAFVINREPRNPVPPMAGDDRK